MEHGTVLEWLVGVGDLVERGDVIAIVDTEKSEIEVEVWQAGTVTEFLVEIGQEVPVGTPLARLSTQGGVEAPPPGLPAPPAPVAVPAVHEEHPGRVVSPLVRRRAEELGVDLEHLVGTGPREAITRADVERAASARPPLASVSPPVDGIRPARLVAASPQARRLAGERGVDLRSIAGTGPGGAVLAADVGEGGAAVPPSPPSPRATIAALMARSNREIPHFHLTLDLDLGPTLTWLAGLNQQRSVANRILPAAVLLQATARAVAAHPEANGFWVDDDFRPGEGVQLGVAVALRGGGLVAPAIPDADQLDTDQTMAALRDLVGRARARRMRSREMSTATITVTNLGDRGVDSVHGVIHPPQVGLVGFGRITERPLVVDGGIVARSMVTATFAGDHRALDGHEGARVLATIDRLLRNPAKLNPPSPDPEKL
ncbi:MAG: 2-oxo acid dehydrogenase subunit E2 [Actinomycetia bacterium]|nr:2-oxo acid dehydrogenase subunit E2 [Actinomycetes bacterium]